MCLHKSPKLDIFSAILNSSREQCCVFVTSLRAKDLVQTASDLGYGCIRAILTRVKRAPKSENESSEDREVDNRL